MNKSLDNLTDFYRNASFSRATLLSELTFKYGIFVITCFGTVGNLLSIAVFSRKCFRTTTTSIFVRVLAVFDTLTLWSYSIWAISNFFQPEINSWFFCKMLNWVMGAAPHIASYTLLTVTLERLTAVIRPLRVHLVFTKRRAMICSGLTMAIPAFYNSIYFYTMTQDPSGKCGVYRNVSIEFQNFWYYFDAIIGVIVPALLIFILNITTIVAFHRSLRQRRAHVIKQFTTVKTKQETENLMNGISSIQGNTQKKRTPTTKRKLRDQSGHHLTVMLILVSLFYWILMLPCATLFIARIHWQFQDSEDSMVKMTQFYHVAYLLMLSNSSLDFVLYAVTARKFRRELLRVLGCVPKSNRGIEMTTNSYY